jgi:hypothetical protein
MEETANESVVSKKSFIFGGNGSLGSNHRIQMCVSIRIIATLPNLAEEKQEQQYLR